MGGPLKKYEVTLPGGRKTMMKLNEADAERYGATPVGAPTEAEASTAETTKARATRNKSRTATNKGGTGGGDD